MSEQKQTSTERVKAHLERKKERKQLLAKQGYVEIPLIVKSEQVFIIENSAKMLKTNASNLLHLITQAAIQELCQRHDDILTRHAEAKMELLRAWSEENPELFEKIYDEVGG
jgi:hypothetical protein